MSTTKITIYTLTGLSIALTIAAMLCQCNDRPKPPPQRIQDTKKTQPGDFSQLRGDDGHFHEY